MKQENYFITTPIYYATGNPHLGHSYTTIACDVISRFQRLLNKNVKFLTGTDEHGQKVVEKAKEKNLSPQEFVNQESQKFIDLTKTLDLSNDYFIRTTNEDHKQFVQKMLQKSYDNEDIYLGEYEGLYCVDCERYYTEDELIDGINCPDHKKPCIHMKQENYFFKLSKYQDKLLQLYKEHPEFISPQFRANEIINRVKAGLEDVSISRSKEFLQWGIEFPFDSNHVTYVWFDALFNYASYGIKENVWPANVNMIGKDIMWFHCVYWPAFLMSVGLELPKKVFAHGMILDKEGHKMSKSLGNVIDPFLEIEKYGLDEFKFYVMQTGSFGEDCRYSQEEFEQIINSVLNNSLGNLISRVYTMTQKYCNNIIPHLDKEKLEKVDDELLLKIEIRKEIRILLDNLEIHKALQLITKTISQINTYVNETEPFKVEDNKRREQILAVLHYSIYNLVPYISIIMPQKAKLIEKQFNYPNKTNLNVEELQAKISIGEKIQIFQKVESEKDEKIEEKKSIQVIDEKRKEIKAIIFDFDGVLIDIYEENYTLSKKIHNLSSKEEHKKLFDGNVNSYAENKYGKEEADEFFKEWDKKFDEFIIEKKIKKEVLNLKENYQLFCVTSNIGKNIEKVLKHSDLENLFKEIYCKGKGNCKAEKINHLLEKYNLDKDEVVFVTDTLGDIKEANEAEVLTIAVDFGYHEKERLEKGAPYKIVSSFKQIRKEIDKLQKHTISHIEIQFSDKLEDKKTNGILHTLHPTQENKKIALFVHGFCAHKDACRSFEFKWQLLSQNYDFITFDLLGCGENKQYPISINSQIKQVEEIIEYLTKELNYEEIILVGHSLGGLNILSQKHKSISKKIAIAPKCFSRPIEEYQKIFGQGSKEEEKSKIKAIFFDFDGVLIDNYKTVYECNKEAYGITEEEFKTLFEGNGVTSFSEKFTKENVDFFWELWNEKIKTFKVEERIKKDILNLKEKYELFCITSNTEDNIKTVLKNSNLENLFEEISCKDKSSCKTEKINHLLEKYNLSKDEVIFITDTLGDIKEANKAKVLSVAVDFGFHEKKRLQQGKPFSIISDFTQLPKQIERIEKKIQQLQPITYIEDDKEFLLSSKFYQELSEVSSKELQKIANSENVQTLILQCKKDPIIQEELVHEFTQKCDNKKVKYIVHEKGTHSFSRNNKEENTFFYKEMKDFIENGIKTPKLQFSDLRMQIGKIVDIKNHPEAEKLYIETIDFGEYGTRQIISGLKDYFTKEEMLGKKVLALTNLQTAKLRGEDSQGMLLLAENKENKLGFLTSKDANLGDFAQLENQIANSKDEISIDEFFSISLKSTPKGVMFENCEELLTIDSKKLEVESNIIGKIR